MPITLQLDKNGFFLYYFDQKDEVSLIDIFQIKDVRTGPMARTPKDPKVRSIVNLGQGQLEDKTITIVYGVDFCNVNFCNFWSVDSVSVLLNVVVNNSMLIQHAQSGHGSNLVLRTVELREIPQSSQYFKYSKPPEDPHSAVAAHQGRETYSSSLHRQVLRTKQRGQESDRESAGPVRLLQRPWRRY